MDRDQELQAKGELDRQRAAEVTRQMTERNMEQSKDLPLYENIDNFISLNKYLTGEGYQLKNIACWIKPHDEPITGQRPITITDFDKFISKIEEIENWNLRHPALWHKTFKLIDAYYTKS